MPAQLYFDAAEDAKALLEELGQWMTVSRNIDSGGAYDPETGTVADAVDLVRFTYGVALDYKLFEINGTQVRIEDQRIYAAPNISEIYPGDRIDLEDGRAYSVVTSRPLNPAGVLLLHDVQARTL